jgi:autotransporter-associated beta strand protein
MKSKFNKTTLSNCNAFIGLALAISTTTAIADISVVRTAAISYVNSTKNGFATAHLGTTARTFDTTGVSKMVVVFSGEPGFNNKVLTIAGVSFNGTPMTKAVNDNTQVISTNDCGDVAIYYLDSPPVATAGTFSFTASSTGGSINGGIATILGISGAAPGVGITAKNSYTSPTAASAPSTGITTSGPNSLVIAAVQNSGINSSAGTPTATAPLIQIHNGNWGSQWGSLASARQTVSASGATITPTFSTNAGGNIHVIAAEFKDATFTSITKADNTDNLNLTNSWVGPAVPGLGDVAVWDSTVTSANTTSLGANIAFAGIKILDPGGAVTINAGNTLTLGGPAIDLDLSTATQNLTVNSDLVMSAPHVWDVAASRTLTLGGAVSGAQPVTKQGLGVVTLSGTSNYTGDTTVTAGSLSVSGSLIGSTTLGNLVVSDTAGNNAVVNIGGDMTFNRLQVGTITGAAGAVNLSAGTVTAGADNELTFTFGAGATTGGYGSLRMTGGTINTSRFQFGGQNVAAQNGVGVGLISNGTVNASSFVILSRYGTLPGTIGSLTVATGGLLNHTSATAGQNLGLGWQGAGRAELNLTGGTITSAGGRVMAYGGGGAIWTGTGIVNLNAGTLTTTAITTGGTNATAYLNFAGGTLKAVSTQAAFLPALTGVYVNGAFGSFSGGAVIDTNEMNITIPAALIAPVGNGVATIPVTSGGSGYIGAPAISITDGGSGFGATAIANMVDDGTGNGTLTVDTITITNPGNNYTAPVASLVGGGNGVTAATLGALTTAANTSGGLTKNGLGTLTLNGANTFTGATSVSDGSLVVNGSLASSAVSIASVATLGGVGSLAGTVTVDSGVQITAGDGTSGTLSTQNLTFSGTGVINVGPLGNYTTNPAIDTPGVLTLSGGVGAVTLNLNTAPVPSGTYRLVGAASGIADATGFTLGTTPALVGRQAAGTVQYDSGSKTVTYTTGGTYPIWSGAQSSEWSTNTISPLKNWQLADMSGGSDFIANDDVLFDNSGALKTVDISNGDVFPTIVNFTNTVGNDYSLQGINGISGIAVLLKTGSGKLTITNPNSHTGGTTISNGILNFVNGSLGTSGPITVNGGTLQWEASNTQDISSRLTLFNSTTATLDTNGNDVLLANAFGGGTSGGLAKVGNGILTLSAANTFTGIININSGTLKIGNATSLGTQAGAADGTTIASGATLDLGGIATGVSAERLTASGTGVLGNGAINSSAAIATPFIGVRYLTLTGDTTLGFTNRWDVGSATAANNGFVGGGFTLNLTGSGAGQASLNFLGETDLGDININLGNASTAIAYLQGNTTLGQPGKTVTITGGSILDVFTNSTLTSIDKKFDLDNGVFRISKVGAMSLPGTIKFTGVGTINANGATVAITSSNEISGNGNFIKAGAGSLALNFANVYSGDTTVSAGALILQNSIALGATAAGTTVADTARVELDNITITGEAITLSGAGTNFFGALQGRSGSNVWTGPITIAADATRIGTAVNSTLTVSGVIDDGVNDYRIMFRPADTLATPSTVFVTGANTYTGGTSIVGNGGPVVVNSINSVVSGSLTSNLGAPTTAANGLIMIGATTVGGTLSYSGPGETTDRTVQIGTNAATPVVGDIGGAAIENNGTGGALTFSAVNFNTPTNALTGTSPTRTLTLGGSNANANTISGIIQNNQIAGALTALVNVAKTGAGNWTLAGANIYTGNTTVTGGTLNITGTYTGNTTASTLALGTAAANTVVNVSNDMTLSAITGANIAGSNTAYNQTAGNVVISTAALSGAYVARIGYGYFNLTGGTFKSNGAFSIGTSGSSSSTAVAYVGGTGFLDWSGANNQTVGYTSAASLTVGPGGSVSRGSSANTTWLATDSGSSAILNVAGGSLNLGTAGTLRVNNTGSGGTSVTFNVAAGTLTMGKVLATNGSNSGSLYANYAGGTLKASATLATSPMNVLTSVSTVFGPIDNVGTAQDFNGGLTIDTDGFSMPYGNALLGVTGNGVKQADIAITPGSGYIGAPLVTFTGGTLAANGTPASGYAVVSGGAVTEIVITSPGTYTVDPTVTLTGGGGSGASVSLGVLSPNPADTGLTKSGAGTLTLSGDNTYTGATSVTVGTLALVGGSQTSPITVSASASLGFTLESPTTSTSTFDLSAGTIKITGTPTLASYTLISSSTGITGTPVLDAPISGYELKVVGSALVLRKAGYASWADINAIGSTPDQDKDGDGVSNAVEYVLGGDVNTNDLSKLPTISTSGGNMLFSFKRARTSLDGSTTVAIEVGTALDAWPNTFNVGTTTALSTPGVTVLEDSPTGFDTITLSVTQAPDPKKFGRLKVTVTP